MTLLEFLNHIKHKSLSITIIDYDGELIMETCVGQYYNMLSRKILDNKKVYNVTCKENLFIIQLAVSD